MKTHYLLLLPLLFCACSANEPNEEYALQQLNDTITRFNQAFSKGDLAVLDSLTTNDYVHTNSSDLAFGKESWFNYLRKRTTEIQSRNLIINSYELLDKEIVMYDNAAIVTGRISYSGSNKGEPFNSEIRVSNFWVKEDGTWKRAGFHDTKVN